MGDGGGEEWRKMADTHKMSPEEVKKIGVESSKRPPGHNPGGVLHQRRSLPFSTTTMTVVGFLMAVGIGYSVLYARKKPEATALDVAKVTTGVANPADTHPRGKATPPEDTSTRK
ncbi:hypothetical protein L1987_66980 [Smallanthus sonchifolius]|uniref:Uncharacterized protein n=1 Tax=Smallanthus sonchifolius TaxID=185202 RepID=A0ACB9BYR9_9ASTR|nr:hypothetical protein L1987_66980 [Smallanthus sonchifolius]